MKTDEKLDATGMLCPLPLLEISLKMKKMKKGEVLEVTATDPAFSPDVKAWCKRTGQKLLELKEKGGILTARIKKRR